MTLMLGVLAVVVAVELAVWVRARLAAAERQRVALEAFRHELGVPAGRFRLVHAGLGWSVRQVVMPWRRLPRFDQVHQVHDDRLLTWAEARVHAGTDPDPGLRALLGSEPR